MAAKEKQVVEPKNPSAVFQHPQMAIFGVLTENTAQMVAVQKSVLGLGTSCVANIVESTIATQTEIARMTLDAMVHGDPIALMSLGQRAMRTGFQHGMDCASRNLQSAQSLGAQILDAVSAPLGRTTDTH